jgi:hypothetical protein
LILSITNSAGLIEISKVSLYTCVKGIKKTKDSSDSIEEKLET